MSFPQIIIDYLQDGDFFNSLSVVRALQAKTGWKCTVRRFDSAMRTYHSYDDVTGALQNADQPPETAPIVYVTPMLGDEENAFSATFNLRMPDVAYNHDRHHISFRSNHPSLPKDKTIENVFGTVPSRVSDALLQRAWNTPLIPEHSQKDCWRDRFSSFAEKKPVLMLMLDADAHWDYGKLARHVSNIVHEMDGSLIVTSSPKMQHRKEDFRLFCSSLDENIAAYVHGFQEETNTPRENPYFAMLHLADAVLVTGKSMSMLADACATTKPVTLLFPDYSKGTVRNYNTPETLIRAAHANYTIPIRLQIEYFLEKNRLTLPQDLAASIGTQFEAINSAPEIADYIIRQLRLQQEQGLFPAFNIPESLGNSRPAARRSGVS